MKKEEMKPYWDYDWQKGLTEKQRIEMAEEREWQKLKEYFDCVQDTEYYLEFPASYRMVAEKGSLYVFNRVEFFILAGEGLAENLNLNYTRKKYALEMLAKAKCEVYPRLKEKVTGIKEKKHSNYH